MATIIQKIPDYIDLQIDFQNVLNLANFPSDRTFLLRLITNEYVKDTHQGMFVAKSLFRAPYGNAAFEVFKNDFRVKWDFGIAVSDKYLKFPAYFLYLFGHELGHAKICLTNMDYHIHACLIYYDIEDLLGRKIEKWELPCEKLCDNFGIYLAQHEDFFSQEQLEGEIKEIIKKQNCKEKLHLKKLLSNSGSSALSNSKYVDCKIMTELRKELVKLSKSYEQEFISIWNEINRSDGEDLVKLLKDPFEFYFK